MNPVLKGYLILARPANLPSAAADIIAGTSIAGAFALLPMTDVLTLDFIALVFASVFLYAGGVVLNDVFDVEIDRAERPERPIPSNLIPFKRAAFYGAVLLLLGIVLAFTVNATCGIIAFSLALAILSYDAFAKKHPFFGPLNMGICRGLNLLLGMAILVNFSYIEFIFVPIVYIAAITMISRGEVHGNNKKSIAFAGLLYAIVLAAIITLLTIHQMNLLVALPFLALFGFLIFRPLINAFRVNSPENIKNAVKTGVISLVVMDACIVVGFSTWWLGLLTLLLLPLSILMAKSFAVT